MVGQLGYIPLASASLMISILSIPSFACLGLTYLISTLVAEHRGKGQPTACFNTAANATLSVISISFIIALIFQFSFPVLYHFGQDPLVVHSGEHFFSWLIWSLVPMSGFICIKQFYDGIELTRIPMILSGFSVVLNLILNFILIYGWSSIPAFGLEGSGIASFISRTLMFFILTLQMSFNKKLKPFGLWQFTIKLASVRKFLRLALPSSWQHTSEVAAFSALAIIAGWFGPKQQAAHQIAITIAAFSYVIYVGLGTAASIRIGESFGRRDHQLILRNGKDSIALAISLAFFLFIILLFFRHTLVMGFNHDEEVLRIASHLLIYGAAFQFSDALQALGIGILRGLQDVRIPTVITTFSYWMIGIPAGYFFSTTLGMKTDGIWLGFVLCLTISAALLIRRFFRLG